MRRDFIIVFALLCLMTSFVAFVALPAHAEDPVVTDPAPGVVYVNDMELYSRLEVMQQTLDRIAVAMEDTEPEETSTPETAPDYSEQLGKIDSTLSKIEINTAPATPETPVSAFDKPFTEYTTTEALLLCLGVVAVVGGVVLVFLRR